ncbi:unnamed protein product [Oncorhynchus mykiss]|uniref:B-cell lymphoma 9 beta-catenin binding domain-containing protein n=1 Tax=Oncorhynchus mykiss TaxID=8022 RepID=A0A060XLY3_ONCMY|nr:unnamed protein product [Oncorhynchus mykiss]
MPTVNHPETIHVWGCFSAKGVGSLTILPKNTAMNKEWYQHILREQLLPTIQNSLVTNNAFSSMMEHHAMRQNGSGNKTFIFWVHGRETPQTGGQTTKHKFGRTPSIDYARMGCHQAADAVFTGHSDNIIAFHMNNISKGNKPHLPVNNQIGPPRGDSKQLGGAPQQQSSHPSDQNHQQASKAPPPGQQQPAESQPQGAKPGSFPQDGAASGGMDSKSGSPQDGTPHDSNSNPGGPPGHQNPSGASQQSFPSLDFPNGADAKLTAQQQQLAHELMSSMGDNSEGLSQEQLEHRERSLQTLRDIQRMLFPDDKELSLKDMVAMGQGNPGGPPAQPRHDGGWAQEARGAGPPPGHDGPVPEPGEAWWPWGAPARWSSIWARRPQRHALLPRRAGAPASWAAYELSRRARR